MLSSTTKAASGNGAAAAGAGGRPARAEALPDDVLDPWAAAETQLAAGASVEVRSRLLLLLFLCGNLEFAWRICAFAHHTALAAAWPFPPSSPHLELTAATVGHLPLTPMLLWRAPQNISKPRAGPRRLRDGGGVRRAPRRRRQPDLRHRRRRPAARQVSAARRRLFEGEPGVVLRGAGFFWGGEQTCIVWHSVLRMVGGEDVPGGKAEMGGRRMGRQRAPFEQACRPPRGRPLPRTLLPLSRPPPHFCPISFQPALSLPPPPPSSQHQHQHQHHHINH